MPDEMPDRQRFHRRQGYGGQAPYLAVAKALADANLTRKGGRSGCLHDSGRVWFPLVWRRSLSLVIAVIYCSPITHNQ